MTVRSVIHIAPLDILKSLGVSYSGMIPQPGGFLRWAGNRQGGHSHPIPPPLPPARLRRGPHAPRGMRTATRSNPSLPLRLARTRLLNRNPNPKPAPNTSPSHTTLPTRARTVTAGRARPAAPRRARSRPPARDRRRARGPPGGAPLLRLRRGAAPRRGLRVPALPPRVLHRVRRVPTRDAAHVPGVPDAQTVAGDRGERFRLDDRPRASCEVFGYV